MTRTIWGREPAVFFGMVANLLMALFMLGSWSEEVHGAVNAVILAASGLAASAFVSVDAALPALTGLTKAILAAVLAFGVHVPENTQVAILAIVTTAVAFVVRSQVTAKVPALATGGVVRGGVPVRPFDTGL